MEKKGRKYLPTFRELVAPATSGLSNLGLLDPENDVITITQKVGDTLAVCNISEDSKLQSAFCYVNCYIDTTDVICV